MIFADESTVKVDKKVLPGLYKSLEVKGSAIIDEQEVEGQTKKPKQATGYEDIKVVLELILEDGPDKVNGIDKLREISDIFRKPGQEKPVVHEIINEHTAARGVKKVIFKDLSSKGENKKSQLTAVLEFQEYSVITVKATKSTGGASAAQAAAQANLNEDYLAYLPDRGAAPGKSPAQDTADPSKYLDILANMPY